MWISRRKYETLTYRINEIKANQRKLELDMQKRIDYMARRILKEPQKLSQELDEKIEIERFINDFIND